MNFFFAVFKVTIVIGLVCFSGCAPTIQTITDYRFTAIEGGDWVQDMEYVTITIEKMTNIPPALRIQVPSMSPDGKMYVDSNGDPILEEASIFPKGTIFYPITIVNNTGHIIRLGNSAIRMFDPTNQEYFPLNHDDLFVLFSTKYATMGSVDIQGYNDALRRTKKIKLLGAQTEILPNYPYSGYVAFEPYDNTIAGIWKFAIYEIPVEYDEAGRPSKTVNYEFNSLLEKWIITYEGGIAVDETKVE